MQFDYGDFENRIKLWIRLRRKIYFLPKKKLQPFFDPFCTIFLEKMYKLADCVIILGSNTLLLFLDEHSLNFCSLIPLMDFYRNHLAEMMVFVSVTDNIEVLSIIFTHVSAPVYNFSHRSYKWKAALIGLIQKVSFS